MAVFRRVARAEDDLVEIWLYIAADSLDAADCLLEEIDCRCQLLAGDPLRGRARPDTAPERQRLWGSASTAARKHGSERIPAVPRDPADSHGSAISGHSPALRQRQQDAVCRHS
jgi:plasmid stabilization system protein ParE